MKKLILATLGIVFVASVQAASVDWSYTVSNATQNQYASGYTAYLFESATWTAAVSAGITASTFESALDSSALSYQGKGMGAASYRYATSDAVGNAGAGRTVTKGAWTNDTTYDFYVVLVNGNADPAQYIATAASMTARDTDQGSNNGTGAFSITSASLTSWTPVSGGGDVPEPTSGLLLLVGGAMLALRRKQK